MTAMSKRVKALEHETIDQLSPACKVWLGHNLTDTEQRALDPGAGNDAGVIDQSTFSEEARAWLDQR